MFISTNSNTLFRLFSAKVLLMSSQVRANIGNFTATSNSLVRLVMRDFPAFSNSSAAFSIASLNTGFDFLKKFKCLFFE